MKLGGHFPAIHRSFFGYVAALVLIFVLSGISPALAITGLTNPQDTINSVTPLRSQVSHSISFSIPTNAQQVTPQDWILINMGNFTSITLPTQMYGNYGSPIFSLSGNIIQITNVVALPGTFLQLYGISATNPALGQSFDVTISVSSDQAGTLLRQSSTVTAASSGGILTVSATIDTVLSSFNFSGYTSPEAYMSLSDSNTVIATTTSGSDGFFDFAITGYDPGDHTFSINATDAGNLAVSTYALQRYLLRGTITNVTGILLSPTITEDKRSVNSGDTITFSGTGKPSSTINVFTESPLRSYSTSTDANGDWTYALPGTELANYNPGEYRAYTTIQDGQGNQSNVSPSATFDVSVTTTSNPAPACNISHGDLNCDSKTNLVDFSILLFHWKTDHKVADINADGNVNLTDFSIMMFYYTK